MFVLDGTRRKCYTLGLSGLDIHRLLGVGRLQRVADLPFLKQFHFQVPNVQVSF